MLKHEKEQTKGYIQTYICNFVLLLFSVCVFADLQPKKKKKEKEKEIIKL